MEDGQEIQEVENENKMEDAQEVSPPVVEKA